MSYYSNYYKNTFEMFKSSADNQGLITKKIRWDTFEWKSTCKLATETLDASTNRNKNQDKLVEFKRNRKLLRKDLVEGI